MSTLTLVSDLSAHVGQTVTLGGWITHHRAKGKLCFFVVRDGSARVQCVLSKRDVDEEVFESGKHLSVETSVRVTGEVKEDARSPGGVEVGVRAIEVVGASDEYPITPKEHGTGFLMQHRHLWLRSSKQHAILRVRHHVERAMTEFLHDEEFIRFDTPILTPCAAEGTSTLFATEYFDEGTAYLAQTGQLYAEAGMAALGRVYCFGPTFRAEKSKTRRHLTEFWMLEPEAAFLDHAGNMELQERMVAATVARVLERCGPELKTLECDLGRLEACTAPFPRITYDAALDLIRENLPEDGSLEALDWGEDFGAPHEVLLSEQFDRPVFVEKYPAKIKAFYMQPDAERPELALCSDLLAPGFGEIIGGSQRIHDVDLLEQRIREHGLDVEDYRWYLDLRRYGSVPHSGFGIGLERFVLWITGISHIREAIPFPRMLYKIYP